MELIFEINYSFIRLYGEIFLIEFVSRYETNTANMLNPTVIIAYITILFKKLTLTTPIAENITVTMRFEQRILRIIPIKAPIIITGTIERRICILISKFL